MPWYYTAIISILLVVSLLTTATGSLLRVAARLKYFTCVLVSKAFAKSFRVGIGIFLKDKNVKHYYILGFRKFSPLIKYICTFFFALKCIQKLCNIQPLVYNWKQTTQPPSYFFDFSIMVQTVGIEQSIHHCFSSFEVKEILFNYLYYEKSALEYSKWIHFSTKRKMWESTYDDSWGRWHTVFSHSSCKVLREINSTFLEMRKERVLGDTDLSPWYQDFNFL